MSLDEIREIARSHNIKPGRKSKPILIRSIQIRQGNFNCYGTAYTRECGQANCLWREDCIDSLWCNNGMKSA